jgi:NhaP-type Na+/H+ and K+/H+ antiporter
MVGRMQMQIKKTSTDVTLLLLKAASGSVLGLTFGLIVQEVLGRPGDQGGLAFFLVIGVTLAVFLRTAKAWGFTSVFIFDLICVLLGMVLKLYILVAPGA